MCVHLQSSMHVWVRHVCIWIYLFFPLSCLYSRCSWFEAEEARKLRVAVGSFLDSIKLIDTMDQFGWLLYCVYTPALWHDFVQFVMHSYCIVAVLSALHVVNMYAMLRSQCKCTWMVYIQTDGLLLFDAPSPPPPSFPMIAHTRSWGDGMHWPTINYKLEQEAQCCSYLLLFCACMHYSCCLRISIKDQSI